MFIILIFVFPAGHPVGEIKEEIQVKGRKDPFLAIYCIYYNI